MNKKIDPNNTLVAIVMGLAAIIVILASMLLSCNDANAAEYVASIEEYHPHVKKAPQPPQYEFVVNRSTYTMDIIKDGELIDTRRVIVGKPGLSTPLIETQFNNIELNPTWDVPKSIASGMVRKFKSKKDPISYIKRNGYYFVDPEGNEIAPEDINWKTISSKGPYEFKIKQKPGHLNVLGPVMFVLQGTRGVQMHGTSSPKLFEHKNRRFSHGCIRVDGANEVAAMLLNKTPDELTRYRQKIGSGKWIRLENPVQVKVVD